MRKKQSTYGSPGVVAKRYYDPEDRRQRRAGQAQALLAGGGAAAAGFGGRGVYQDSKKAREAITNTVSANNKNADLVRQANEDLARRKKAKLPGPKVALIDDDAKRAVNRVVSVRGRNAALIGGGAAGVGAAVGINRHMKSSRGRGWN